MTKKSFLIIEIIVLVLAIAFIYKMNTTGTDKVAQPVSSPDVVNQANQITMKVINVDENADAKYATVWLTPSARIYKLAKNISEYKTYLGLMEQSKKDGSLLTFTLAADDLSIIKSVNK